MNFSRPILSVIVIFHNMQREANRTLFSLSRAYQIDSHDINYEVIAIDSNSTTPLDSNLVQSFGDNYRHHNYKTNLYKHII